MAPQKSQNNGPRGSKNAFTDAKRDALRINKGNGKGKGKNTASANPDADKKKKKRNKPRMYRVPVGKKVIRTTRPERWLGEAAARRRAIRREEEEEGDVRDFELDGEDGWVAGSGTFSDEEDLVETDQEVEIFEDFEMSESEWEDGGDDKGEGGDEFGGGKGGYGGTGAQMLLAMR